MKQLIKQLREAEERATKREWFTTQDKGKEHLIYARSMGVVASAAERFMDRGERMSNAKLIALMRNNLIPLLDYVEELQARIEYFEAPKNLSSSIFTPGSIIKLPEGAIIPMMPNKKQNNPMPNKPEKNIMGFPVRTDESMKPGEWRLDPAEKTIYSNPPNQPEEWWMDERYWEAGSSDLVQDPDWPSIPAIIAEAEKRTWEEFA